MKQKDSLMHRLILSLLLCMSCALAGQREVRVVTIDGVIHPASSEYIHRSLESAERDSVECFILRLNTPGGLVVSMREITTDIMGAAVPVVVYVAPSGARAGSAGVFITLSGHVAAMAPGTNIGAASVVSMGMSSDSLSSTMLRKATNDAIAYIRSIAEERGRNADWAEKAVRDAASVTAREALDLDVVDYIAPSIDSLLLLLDGLVVETRGGRDTLHTSSATVVFDEKSLTFKILDIISDPTIAYFLLIIALWGFMFELYNPGGIIPGVVGAICFILFLYGASTLPVNYAGVLLMILALILFILEVKIPSYGALTIGGVISFVLGSVMLYDTQAEAFSIPWEIIAVVTAVTALFFFVAIGLGLRAQSRKVAIGQEQLVENVGEAIENFRKGRGQILFDGEIWQAVSQHSIRKGEPVRILKVDGLVLTVSKQKTAG